MRPPAKMLLALGLKNGSRLINRLCCQTASLSRSLQVTTGCNVRLVPLQTTPLCRTVHTFSGWLTPRLSSCSHGVIPRPPIHTCGGFFCRSMSSFSQGGSRRSLTAAHSVMVNAVRTRISKAQDKQAMTTLIYITSIGVVMLGLSYAGVPLYKIFCQATGFGGVPTKGHDPSKVADMSPVRERALTIQFNADTASSMQWNFRPQQTEIQLVPGETALAFYTARNPTDKAIIGISTYNVIPFEAGQYFNKIQCFCFEEQRLNAHEDVDMPVFFYIDPEIIDDPKLEDISTIILSYTFFEAKEGMSLPLPGYLQTQ